MGEEEDADALPQVEHAEMDGGDPSLTHMLHNIIHTHVQRYSYLNCISNDIPGFLKLIKNFPDRRHSFSLNYITTVCKSNTTVHTSMYSTGQ